MIYFKTAQDIDILQEGGKKLGSILKKVGQAAQPGVSTADLDKLAFDLICECGGKPAFLNYQPSFADKPFPSSLCTSINEVVVHGLPSKEERLKEGDVISWFPFNHFGDENSDFKSELEDYHVKPLKIKKIDRNYIDSWNGGVKVVINIHLEIIRKKKCSVC